MSNPQQGERLPNYIRIHRRRTSLTQYELGMMIGYKDAEGVARHEKSIFAPSLELAISYEIVFRVPVSEIFGGLRDKIAEAIELRLAKLEEELGQRSALDRNAASTARKLMWLKARKSPNYEPLA